MPTISMFFGPGEHPPPHFHAYYNEYKATINIHTCEIIEGDLPRKQVKLVLAWAELHQEELMADWRLVTNGEEPFKTHHSSKERRHVPFHKRSDSAR